MPLALLRFSRHPVTVGAAYAGFLALTIAVVSTLSSSVTLQTATHSQALLLPKRDRVPSRVDIYEASLREPVTLGERRPLLAMREPALEPAALATKLDAAEVSENPRPIRPAFVSLLAPLRVATLEGSASRTSSRSPRGSWRMAAIAPWEANFSLRGSRASRRR
jgi:hypothetical protein